jgi:RNA polymerase sigma-70 factor (ECF subfamily)
MISTAVQTESPPMEEIQLVRDALSDAEAFAELYRRNLNRVYRYHMAHTGNVKDAEDLTSQTFMAALEGLASFRGEAPFAAWLMGIASRKRALFFRRHRPELPLDAALHIPAPGLLTDQLAGQRLQIDSVIRALHQLSPDRREALILCYFSGLSHAESARVLDKTEAAVKMLVSRGLQDLRERTSLALEVEK